MNTLTCKLRLSALLVLMIAPLAVASAQDVGHAAEPETLLELDEVVVRGERLIDAIVKAEDAFYAIYNQVNKDNQYDVNCTRMNLTADSGSRMNSRLCLPSFVASAIADYAAFKVACEPEFSSFDSNRDGRISRMEAMANPDLHFQFDSLDENSDGMLMEFPEFRNFANWAIMNMNCYRPPPPDLVLVEGTDRWYDHMMKVTNSDPRLREMAGELDELHNELTMVQRRYREVTDEQARARAEALPASRNTGPRPR